MVPDQGPVRRRSGVAHHHGVLLHIRAERFVGVAGYHGDPGSDAHACHGHLGRAEEGGRGGNRPGRFRPWDEHRYRPHAEAGGCLEVPLGYEPAPHAAGDGRDHPPGEAACRHQHAHGTGGRVHLRASRAVVRLRLRVHREIGSRPFFTAHEAGTRSDYTYFSSVTMATVGYGDLTAQRGSAGPSP